MGLIHTRSYRDELIGEVGTLKAIRYLMLSRLLEETHKLPDVARLIDLIDRQINDSQNNLNLVESNLYKEITSAQKTLDDISKRYEC